MSIDVTIDADLIERDVVAGRCNCPGRKLERAGVGARARPAACDAIALGDLIVERYVQVWHRGPEEDSLALDTVSADLRWTPRPMAEAVGCHELVSAGEVAVPEHLEIQMPGALFVLLHPAHY